MSISRFLPRAALALSTVFLASLCSAQQISVKIDGANATFNDTQPQMIDGSVYVPIRGIFEQMGATVDWDASQQEVMGKRGNHRLTLRVMARSAMVDNRAVRLTGRAQIIGGSVMVPLRFVSEALGAHVDWDDSSKTVTIRSEDGHFISRGLRKVKRDGGGIH